jgi:phosphatidylglycerol:prolipoprotein diacylglycerol transferase
MRRVLFHCFGLPMYSYPVMVYLGLVLGIYVQLYAALSIGVDTGATLTATLVLVATALLGARLLYVVPRWRVFRKHPSRVLRFSEGGASMYGGILLAVPISVPVLALLAIPFGVFWDLASLTMLVGMIVARVGCLLNGCCAGRPASAWWAIRLPNDKGVWRRRIPTQMLEIAWSLAVLAGAAALWGRLPFQGALFFYTIGAYGAGRIVLEAAREEQDHVMGVSVQQAISAACVVVSIGAFTIREWL